MGSRCENEIHPPWSENAIIRRTNPSYYLARISKHLPPLQHSRCRDDGTACATGARGAGTLPRQSTATPRIEDREGGLEAARTPAAGTVQSIPDPLCGARPGRQSHKSSGRKMRRYAAITRADVPEVNESRGVQKKDPHTHYRRRQLPSCQSCQRRCSSG